MKQNISPDQWSELTDEQKEKIEHSLKFYTPYDGLLNIGLMIEFLGKDLSFIEWNYSPRDVKVLMDHQRYCDDNLCDALWEACKNKLNVDEKE